MSFGENVGYYRRQLNITQEELAEKLFVSRQTVSRWETDSAFPDVETVIKLCEIFGCTMDNLVRGDAQGSAPCEGNEKKACENEEIEKIKEEIRRKRRLNERLMGAIAGPLAMISVLAYLLCGFLGGWWHPAWLIFVGFAVVCGVSAVIIDATLGITSDAKKLRYEKKKHRS